MINDRWQRIDQLVQKALSLGTHDRAAFIAKACAGDDELRREVESLLEAHDKVGDYFAVPAMDVAAALMAGAQSPSLEGRTVSHYKLSRKIGEGGMGSVYLAHDTSLDRQVAIKFISLDSAEDELARKRLVREARAAARLDHANICSVYEVAEQDGLTYIVMQYVEGETLSERIRRKPLEIKEAIAIAAQIADALAEAHSRGIIHRDIKPQNIMITARGQAKVLDFGLAKMVRREEVAVSEIATESLMSEPGMIAGTVPYMSPEQLRGEAIDARSDIFSFGVVMYEMVSGRRPFAGETAGVILSAILTHQPAPLARYSADAPPELERIVSKALCKKREERYQTARDLFIDLKSLRHQLEFEREGGLSKKASAVEAGKGLKNERASVSGAMIGKVKRHKKSVALLLAAIALAAAAAVFFYPKQTEPLTDKDSVLIADFENKTGDEIFDGALKQALAVQLEQSPFLNIVSEERVRETLRYMSRSADERLTRAVAREVCLRQGIKAMVISSISGLGSHYVIGLEAVNAQTGEAIAREQIEAESKEQVIGVLGKAATRFRAKLGESLASIQKFDAPIEQATTASLEAFKAYSLGREQVNRGNNLDAIPLFKRAIELDPDFALAYSWLSAAYGNTRQAELSVEPGERAFALRDRVSERERFRISVIYYRLVTEEWDKLLETLELWKQMYPRDYLARNGLANNLAINAQFGKAIEEGSEAIRLNPSFAASYRNVARAFISLNRFDEAKQILERAQQRFVHNLRIRATHYEVAFIRGDPATMKQLLDLGMGDSETYIVLGAQARTMAFAGQLHRARALSERAMDLAEQRNVKEVAASYAVEAAMSEAFFGLCQPARQYVAKAFALSQSSYSSFPDIVPVLTGGALALVMCGEVGRAESLAEKIVKQRPKATLSNSLNLPLIRAAIELQRGHPDKAIQALKVTDPYEAVGSFWPNYLRGQAYLRKAEGAQAAAEYQKILDHRGWDPTSYLYPLAHLGLARAAALTGDPAKSRKSYEEFFAIWKDADPDIPILIEARKEYVKLK